MIKISGKFKFKIYFSLPLILLLSLHSLIIARTDVFTPEKGFIIPNMLNGFKKDQEIGSVFHNPAGIAGSLNHQIKLDTSHSFIGYNYASIAYLMPVRDITMSIAYLSFYANDLLRTRYIQDARPEITGTFGHSNQLYNFAAASNINEKLKLGLSVDYMKQSLDSDYADTWIADLGLIYQFLPYGWLSIYSKNLYHSNYQWKKSEQIEHLTKKYTLETIFEINKSILILSKDNYYSKTGINFWLSDNFSIIADVVLNNSFNVSRYSYGAIISAGSLAIQYSHVSFLVEAINIDQDFLGISFKFSPPSIIRKRDLDFTI
ncbi:MAG: hypothetical protein GY730_06945 [bacterium]|nr:hypothetical protein [bacterium]